MRQGVRIKRGRAQAEEVSYNNTIRHILTKRAPWSDSLGCQREWNQPRTLIHVRGEMIGRQRTCYTRSKEQTHNMLVAVLSKEGRRCQRTATPLKKGVARNIYKRQNLSIAFIMLANAVFIDASLLGRYACAYMHAPNQRAAPFCR